MDMRRALILLTAVIAIALFIMPAGAFIGAGINLNKQLGKTVAFKLSPVLAQAAGVAAATAGMDLGVTWGANYDINALAGYPFGYGGVGAITDADVGYNVGLSMDEGHAAAFNGAPFGVPLGSQTASQTVYNNAIAANEHFANEQVALPWAFPIF